jgi:hypothetical protein
MYKAIITTITRLIDKGEDEISLKKRIIKSVKTILMSLMIERIITISLSRPRHFSDQVGVVLIDG